MILLVPLNPEVPHLLKPRLWPSILMVGLLFLGYFLTKGVLLADAEYVDSVETTLRKKPQRSTLVDSETEDYLSLRPLLMVAPAQGDWNMERIIKANFIHGSLTHLLLNSIGIFAGIRLCMTFIPFLTAFAIFLLGGSTGLLISLLTSKQISEFIPHVGSSAGLFALMGTYYIYNFRFRTQYFFWLPIRQGFVCLRTSWFFFVDVILLELILSTAQLFPERIDSIDHIAHVIGFSSGMLLAVGVRFCQRWPSFLQTRGEYLYWHHFVRHNHHYKTRKTQTWLALLRINRYNDFLKIRICNSIKQNPWALSDTELNEVFKFFVPTFVRLQTAAVSNALQSLLAEDRHIPKRWLSRIPYDILIRLAKLMAASPKEHGYLYRFLLEYKIAQASLGKSNTSVEKLMARLELEVIENEKGPAIQAI